MIEVHIVWDLARAERLVFAGERVGETLYVYEAGPDGEVQGRRHTVGELRKPLLRLFGHASNDLAQALVNALAKEGFRPPDDRIGVVPALETALTDTKATRDRLLTLIEKVVK